MTKPKLSNKQIEFLHSLRDSVSNDHQKFVEQWTEVKCFYELVVKIIYNRLSMYFLYGDKDVVSDFQVRRAIGEIVRMSPLNELVTFDETSGLMPFRKSVANETQEEISQILLKETEFMPTPIQNENESCGE
jgi:hypothetical protein